MSRRLRSLNSPKFTRSRPLSWAKDSLLSERVRRRITETVLEVPLVGAQAGEELSGFQGTRGQQGFGESSGEIA